MTFAKNFLRFALCLCSLMLAFAAVPQTAFGQKQKLGIVNYVPPSGWHKTQQQGNVIVFSTMNESTKAFCMITLHGATPGTGDPQSDFKKEWNSLVVQNMKADANPATESEAADGWTATGGGGAVDIQGTTGMAFLTVISGFGKAVSVLGVLSDQACVPQLQTFLSGIEMDKVAAPASSVVPAVPASTATATPTLDQWGNLFIPPPTRQLTIADLVGNWGDNPGRISTQYVFRDSGSHAGTDSLHFTSKWTIDGDGGYVNDFFEVRNGKKLRDITTGTVSISGRVISIKREKSTAKYVVRGWLELSDMTVLKVAGPWYDNQEIPERTFTDPPDSYMLTSKWVRVN